MLGPSLVALGLGLVILVVIRALRRGPTVAARSAPDHGVPQPAAQASDSGDHKQLIPAQRRAGERDFETRTASGRRLLVRPTAAGRARAVARRVLSRP